MVERPGGEHGHRSGFLPRPGSDRRIDRHQLRLRQRHRRDPDRRRAHFPDQHSDRLLCVALRRRHRPADARRRLRLHRLDHHLADLCLVHVPVLRDRSRDHVARPGDVLRDPAVHRLHHQFAGRHPAGHARHHADQPFPGLDAAVLAVPAPAAVRLHRLLRATLVRGMDAVSRHRRIERGDIQPPAVRHRLDRGVLADRADRRAGGLPALPAAARCKAAVALVGRLAVGGAGLDRARRAQDAGGLVPRVPRDPEPDSAREGGRADADVSGRVPIRVFVAGARARIHRRVRHHLAAQDQRHQRLCRLDRVVEFLLAADPQPSRAASSGWSST